MAATALVLAVGLAVMMGRLVVALLGRHVGAALREPVALWGASLMLGLGALGGMHFLTFLVGTPPGLTNLLLTIGTLALLLALALWRRTSLALPVDRWVRGYFVYVAFLWCVLTLVPSYDSAFTLDWALYASNISFYLGGQPVDRYLTGLKAEYLFKRTPTLSLYAACIMSLTRYTFDVMQAACLASNSVVYFVVAWAAQRWGGARLTAWALVLLALGPALLRQTTVTEPKVVAAACVWLAWLGYGWSRDEQIRGETLPGVHGARAQGGVLLAGVFGVLAVMLHPGSLFYVMWIFVYDAVRGKSGRHAGDLARLWGAAVATTVLLFVPWFGWVIHALGVGRALQPTLTISAAEHMSFGQYVVTRLQMMVSTWLFPLDLARDIAARKHPLLATPGWTGAVAWVRDWGDWILRSYEQTYLGGIGYFVGIFVFIWAWPLRARARWAGARWIWIAGALGALLSFGVHLFKADNQGQATNLTAPLFLFFVVLAAHVLGNIPGWARAVLLGGLVVETSVTRWVTYVVTLDRPTPPLVPVFARGSGEMPIIVRSIAAAICVGVLLWMFRRELWGSEEIRGEASGLPSK